MSHDLTLRSRHMCANKLEIPAQTWKYLWKGCFLIFTITVVYKQLGCILLVQVQDIFKTAYIWIVCETFVILLKKNSMSLHPSDLLLILWAIRWCVLNFSTQECIQNDVFVLDHATLNVWRVLFRDPSACVTYCTRYKTYSHCIVKTWITMCDGPSYEEGVPQNIQCFQTKNSNDPGQDGGFLFWLYLAPKALLF
jgi:hypothetical protein